MVNFPKFFSGQRPRADDLNFLSKTLEVIWKWAQTQNPTYAGFHGIAGKPQQLLKKGGGEGAPPVQIARFKSYGSVPFINIRRVTVSSTGTVTELDTVDVLCSCFVFGNATAWTNVWPALTVNRLIPIAMLEGDGRFPYCVLTFGDTCAS